MNSSEMISISSGPHWPEVGDPAIDTILSLSTTELRTPADVSNENVLISRLVGQRSTGVSLRDYSHIGLIEPDPVCLDVRLHYKRLDP